MDTFQTYPLSSARQVAPDAALPSGPSPAESNRTTSHRRSNFPRHRQVKDLWELTKPEISFLVTLSALAGFLLGTPSDIDGLLLFHTLMGVALTASGSGMLNHYRERNIDKIMRRTTDRPLPAGRVSPRTALILGLGLVAAGATQLLLFVNALTAGLGILTVALYLGVYTPLKRVTPYNTLIGCFPGALPALGGWVAATGSFGLGGWLLFGILFTWQMPHFLALAWMYRHDYARGGFAMLSVDDRQGNATARQTLLFTGLLVMLSLLPTFFHLTGWIYFAGALALGIYFLEPAIRFLRTRTNRAAKRVLTASIVYVPVLVGLIFIDRFVI